MFTDAVYTCPTCRLALAASPHGPTYRYLYTHVMENDPVGAMYRAGHAFEESFVWMTSTSGRLADCCRRATLRDDVVLLDKLCQDR